MAKKFTTEDVLNQLRSRVDKSTMRKVAKELGVSVNYVSDALRGNRGVGEKLASALGFRKLESRPIEAEFERLGRTK